MVVSGNVQIEKMTGTVATQAPTIEKENVQFVDNVIPANEILFIDQNTITAGKLQVFKNKGPDGKFVRSNTVVNGVNQCFENDTPFFGAGNVGRAPDQPPFLLTGHNQCMGT